MSRQLINAFKPHGEGLEKLFGSLESSILELLWQQNEASARDIFEGLRDQGQRLSYGAVKTVLDRLVKKQVLDREMTANQYLYRPRLRRDEFVSRAVGEIVSSLLASFSEPVYAQFLGQMSADPDQLAHLTKLINEAEARGGDRVEGTDRQAE